MSFRIRPAVPDDAAAIAAAHVQGWEETYRGILPDHMIDARDLEYRRAQWERSLAAPGTGAATFVAEDDSGIAGFVTCGDQHSADLRADYPGEFHAIYVLRRAQRRGVGRALLQFAARHLADRGIGAASLWALKRNAQAVRFYTALGGIAVTERTEVEDGVRLTDTAFGWPDLSTLLR